MEIPDRAQSQELSILCSFWEPIGACGLQTRTDGRPRKDHGDTEFESTKECEIVVLYPGVYGILQKVD